jgi:nucleotide-binding universal stress UspA family protein
MKKFIAAFDGLKYSKETRDCAIRLSQEAGAHLVGVFLDDLLYTSYNVYDMVVNEQASEGQVKKLEQQDKDQRAAAAADFTRACEATGMPFSVHHQTNAAIQSLKHESIYADLLFIDARETFTHYTEKPPTRFIRELLNDTQCPVLLLPGKYKPFAKLVLLFDGEPSSVYAIKMLSYLLPHLKALPTEVVSVNPAVASGHLPDNKMMKEFMKRHFPKAQYTVMKGIAELEITDYLKQQPANTLVALGAYRRGAVSRWFRESMADTLMRQIKLSLFIAHNK